MPTMLDRKGHFRVTIEEYGWEKAKETNAHCVVLKCLIREQYDFEAQDWMDWRQYGVEVWGRIYIIKKDGNLNSTACESLIKNAGWDGDIMSIQNKSWEPLQCSVSVEESTWEGKTSYKIGFVNGWDEVPSGKVGNLDDSSAAALAARYGASLRAIAGTAKQAAAPKPAGKPPAPKAREPATVSANSAPPEDEVPF